MAKSSKRPSAADSQARSDSKIASSPSSSFSSSPSSSEVGFYDRDRVAMRAYELYMARGASHGADMDDWLAAEREFAGNGHGDLKGE
jgi:hypothetical protein